MSVNPHAHQIQDGAAELDQVSYRLFGRLYIQLEDSEADAVWRDIESREAAR